MLALGVLAVLFLVGFLLLIRAHARNVSRLTGPPDMRRAGEETSRGDAALRASGTNAWMRPGGF